MKLNDVLKYSIWTGIFVIPFIPFVVAGSMFFPFITGKTFLFRIIVEVIFFFWILLAIRDKEYRPRFSWLLASFTAFTVVMALATFTSQNPFKSFWSNFERMEGYITILHLFAYFLVVGSVLKTQKIWGTFLNTSIGASLIMVVYVIFQLAGYVKINQGGVRTDGTLGNSAYLAVYMLVHIFLTAFMLVKIKRNVWLKYSYGLVIILQIFALYHTATRGAMLGLIVGVFVTGLLIAIFERENKLAQRIAFGTVAISVILVVGFMFARNASFIKNSPVLSRFSSISLTETTTKSRFMVWSMAWQGFKERPVLGWGQESFNYVFNKYYNPQMYGQEQWFDRSHRDTARCR
ncbi:MAG: O-antigen ligase family protein [Patescibacteria group bacterium]